MISFCSKTHIVFAAMAVLPLLCSCTELTYGSDESQWQSAREQAITAVQQKNYTLAEAKYKEALQHAKALEAAGPGHFACSLTELAELYRLEGKDADAKECYKQALAGFEEMKQSQDKSELYKRIGRLNEAKAQASLGDIYRKEGDLKNAEEMYRKALTIGGYGMGAVAVIDQVKLGYGELLRSEGRLREANKLQTAQDYTPF